MGRSQKREELTGKGEVRKRYVKKGMSSKTMRGNEGGRAIFYTYK